MPALQGGRMLVQVRVIGPTGSAYARLRVDTGDDVALLSPVVLPPTGAVPIATVDIIGVDGMPVQAPVYLVDIDVGPGQGTLQGVQIVGYPLSNPQWDGLFGDNLLDQCNLSRNGPAGTWSLSVVQGAPPPARASRVLEAAGVAGVLSGALLAAAALDLLPRRR